MIARFYSVVLAFLMTTALHAQEYVEVVKNDDSRIEGYWIGFKKPNYVLKLADGSTREIPEEEVKNIVLLSKPPEIVTPPVQPPQTSSSLQTIEKSIRAADFTAASTALLAQEQQIQSIRAGTDEYRDVRLREIFEPAVVRSLLAAIAGAPGIPDTLLHGILDLVLDQLEKETHAASAATLAGALASSLDSRLPVAEPRRGRLVSVLDKLLEIELIAGRVDRAWEIGLGMARFDASQKAALISRLVKGTLTHARQLQNRKLYAEALQVIQKLLQEPTAAGEARTLLDEVEFEQLQHQVSGATQEQIRSLLEQYLRGSHPAEHLRWAKERLSQVSARPVAPDTSGVPADLARYFPIVRNRKLVYLTEDRRFQHEISFPLTRTEGDTLQVFVNAEEFPYDKDRGRGVWSNPKTYRLSVDANSIYRTVAGVRTILFRTPLVVGDEWSWEEGQTQSHRTRVESLTATVTVPAGTYTGCLEVVSHTTMLSETESPETTVKKTYYAPQVGLVKVTYDSQKFSGDGLELLRIEEPKGR